MARTPTMTPEEAIAAIGHPRGQLFVTSVNKPLVRKWATAMGLPGKYAATLANAQLAGCYNGKDRNGDNDRLDWHKTQAAAQGVTGDDESEESTDTVSDGSFDGMSNAAMQSTVDAIKAERIANGHPSIIEANKSNGHDTDKANQLARLLLDITSRPQGVDAKAVTAIIDSKWAELPELIAKYSPITTIEVKHESGKTTAVEGYSHKELKTVLEMVAENEPVLLVGPAGGGKSTAGEQISHALGIEFYIQGAASGTHEYLGYKDAYGNYHATPFRQAFEHGGLFMAEELDSGSADVPLILNAGLANGHMAFPDATKPIKRHADFRIIANANTYGTGADRIYVGRTQLDGATIDRFGFIAWDYDTALERKLCNNDAWCDRVQALRRGVEAEKARIIISPRASIKGAKMIATRNWTFAQCEQVYIWKGTDAELRRRIEGRAV